MQVLSTRFSQETRGTMLIKDVLRAVLVLAPALTN